MQEIKWSTKLTGDITGIRTLKHIMGAKPSEIAFYQVLNNLFGIIVLVLHVMAIYQLIP